MRRVLPLALVAACAHRATPPAAPLAPPTAPVVAAPATPLRAAPHREPEASPPEFAHARNEDLDGDGLDDRVIPWPDLGRFGSEDGSMTWVPAALVAHALPDGRFAVDDDVTRAALRAVCFAPVEITARTAERTPPEDVDRATAARQLVLDAVCAQAWGLPLDEALARVRHAARASTPDLVRDEAVARIETALRAMPVIPLLRAVGGAPLPLVDRAPAQGSAASSAPVAPPVDARCVAVLRENTRSLAAAERVAEAQSMEGGLAPHVETSELPACVASPQGVWALRFGASHAVPHGEDEEPAVEIAATLEWRPTRGRVLRASRVLRCAVTGWDVAGLELASDYDGDGVPEVLLRTHTRSIEGAGMVATEFLTVQRGSIARYAPGARWESQITSLTDADGDGRLDLVLPSPWFTVDGCGLEGVAHAGPDALAHALPDGRFTSTDAVAHRYTLDGCAQAPAQEDGPAVEVLDVACARLRGMDAEDTVAATARRRPNAAGIGAMLTAEHECLPLAQLASMAVRRPRYDDDPTRAR